MKNNILIFFGWSVRYISYTRVIAMCNFIKLACELDKSIVPIFYFRNKKFYNYCKDIISTIDNSSYIIRDVKEKNWDVIRDNMIKIYNDYNINSIFLSSMPILDSFRHGNEKTFKIKRVNRIYEDNLYGINFSVAFNFYLTYMEFIFLLNHDKDIKLFQYLDDPWEMSFKELANNEYKLIYEYELEDRKTDIQIPLIGYSFFFKDNQEYIKKQYEKQYDFTTGFMLPYFDISKEKVNEKLLKQSRIIYGKNIENIENKFENSGLNYNLFYKIKGHKKEKVIKDYEYNNLIAESKFSFILPSPRANEIPITRLYYSLARDCIPFLDVQMNFENNFFKKEKQLKEFFFKYKLVRKLDEIPGVLFKYIKYFDYIRDKMNKLDFVKRMKDIKHFENKFNNVFK